MIPGEIITASGDIELNAGRSAITLDVANTGDRPIQVGSHYHFFETNAALQFDRAKARGMRLDIPAGTAVRFEPGQTRTVALVAYAGARVVHGFNGKIDGPLDTAPPPTHLWGPLMASSSADSGRFGTMGVVLYAGSQPYLLTARHVLAEGDAVSNTMYMGDTLIGVQSFAVGDIGGEPTDAVVCKANRVPGLDYAPGIKLRGDIVQVDGIADPVPGMEVIKNGLVTGVTRGRVKGLNASGSKFIISGDAAGVSIARRGDSGSLWMTQVDGRYHAVGLLTGGELDSETRIGYSTAIPMRILLSKYLIDHGLNLAFKPS